MIWEFYNLDLFRVIRIIRNFLILAALLIFAVPSAQAAIILQAPKYIGLNSGLVGSPRWSIGEAGYWSFDGKDIA